jgi:hypothetical protein
MDWQRELLKIVQTTSLVPTFDQWLDATGYREDARRICSGPINLQATAMSALYDYYQTEMKRRRSC